MRITIEKLAWLLSAAPGEATIGQLAAQFGQEPGRIMDAMDVLKIMRGDTTQLPPVDWSVRLPASDMGPCADGRAGCGVPELIAADGGPLRGECQECGFRWDRTAAIDVVIF
jgi:hypothetical protein